jgi:hypothetical protein
MALVLDRRCPWQDTRHLPRRPVRRHPHYGRGRQADDALLAAPSLVGELEPFQHDTFIARGRDRELRADAYVTFALASDGSIDQEGLRAVPLTACFWPAWRAIRFGSTRVTALRPW